MTIPRRLIAIAFVAALAAIPLTDYFPQRSYGAVVHKGRQLSSRARSFLEILDAGFAERWPAPAGQPWSGSVRRLPAGGDVVAPLAAFEEGN